MALADDLGRIAAAASAHGEVTGVLAAEPADGVRRYLVALGGDDERRWLVVGDDGAPATRRDEVRDAASIVAMCEIAADIAAELGIDAGEEPRIARPGYLDELGAAAVGSQEFVDSLRGGTGAVEELVREVERGYAVPLR